MRASYDLIDVKVDLEANFESGSEFEFFLRVKGTNIRGGKVENCLTVVSKGSRMHIDVERTNEIYARYVNHDLPSMSIIRSKFGDSVNIDILKGFCRTMFTTSGTFANGVFSAQYTTKIRDDAISITAKKVRNDVGLEANVRYVTPNWLSFGIDEKKGRILPYGSFRYSEGVASEVYKLVTSAIKSVTIIRGEYADEYVVNHADYTFIFPKKANGIIKRKVMALRPLDRLERFTFYPDPMSEKGKIKVIWDGIFSQKRFYLGDREAVNILPKGVYLTAIDVYSTVINKNPLTILSGEVDDKIDVEGVMVVE